MKLHLTFTKFFVAALFVLGFVLPVTAEQMPQPYKSFDNNIVDWWDEYEYMDSTRVPVKISKEEHSLKASRSQSFDTASINVVDWWDEFTYVGPQTPSSPKNMLDHPMPKKQYDTSWMLLEDW